LLVDAAKKKLSMKEGSGGVVYDVTVLQVYFEIRISSGCFRLFGGVVTN